MQSGLDSKDGFQEKLFAGQESVDGRGSISLLFQRGRDHAQHNQKGADVFRRHE